MVTPSVASRHAALPHAELSKTPGGSSCAAWLRPMPGLFRVEVADVFLRIELDAEMADQR